MNTCEPTPRLLVADSFRVRARPGGAEVRGPQLHLERFRRSVSGALSPEHNLMLGGLDAFLSDARRRMSEFGEGFPRLELWHEPNGAYRYECALRPLPSLSQSLAMRSTELDPRPQARIKGPNIALYAALNRQLGAEALLVGTEGFAREGATTSLVFWRDGRDDSGHVIADDRRVGSVAEAILKAAARGRLTPATITTAELQQCEVWAVNALHGIRPVTHLDGAELPRFSEARLRWFQAALDRAWEPLVG